MTDTIQPPKQTPGNQSGIPDWVIDTNAVIINRNARTANTPAPTVPIIRNALSLTPEHIVSFPYSTNRMLIIKLYTIPILI